MNEKKNEDQTEIAIKTLEMNTREDGSWNDEDLSDMLSQSMVNIKEQITSPPQVIWVNDCTMATIGNFSASTGKAKSKKTFNVSAIVAAAMTNGSVLNYRAKLPEDKRRIIYFDTEQARYHCRKVLQRIVKLANLPEDEHPDNLDFVCLREYSPTLRLRLIDYVLRTNSGIGLVIIDGIRDLMYDINNAKEATNIITMLMSWTSRYEFHLHCVLHLNKGDNNPRGHIGTELENKAETVLVISKNSFNSNISAVRPLHMRDKEFDAFAFHIDENALPVLEDGIQVTVVRNEVQNLTLIDEDEHQEILEEVFDGDAPKSYMELLERLKNGYGNHGYNRGINAFKKLLKQLMDNRCIYRDSRCYYYNPDISPNLKSANNSDSGQV